MNGACNSTIFWPCPLGPWGGVKNIIKFQLQSQFQRFLYQILCALTNKRYKTYQKRVSFCRLDHAPGWDLGRCGCPGGQKFYFFKHGHVAYQIDGDDEQNRMQVKFSPLPCGEVKQSNIIKFQLQGQFQRLLYKSLRVFSQIKDRNILNVIFILLPGSCPRGGTWGSWGDLRWQSTAHSSLVCYIGKR